MAEESTSATTTAPAGVEAIINAAAQSAQSTTGLSGLAPESGNGTGTESVPAATDATGDAPGMADTETLASADTAASPSGPLLSTFLQEDSLKDHPSLSRYTTVEALAKAYLSSEEKLGQKGALIPAEDADREAWSEFYKQIPGYPESPDDYNLTADVMQRLLPEGALSPGEEELSVLRQVCHEEGIRVQGLARVVQWYGALMSSAVERMVADREQQGMAQRETLEKVWGANTDRNMMIAYETIRRKYGDRPAFLHAMIPAEDGNSTYVDMAPEIAQAFYQLGMAEGTDKFVQFNGTGMMTPEQAQQHIDVARQRQLRNEITNEELGRIIEQYQHLAAEARGAAPRVLQPGEVPQ